MSRLPVPLGTLEIFAEAGRQGSFKLAAGNLALSTSAVSQAVRKLEARIGQPLFRRVGNGLEITPEGRRLLAHVEAGLEEMRSGLAALMAEDDRPVSISGPPGIASQLLSPVIQELLEREVTDVRFVSNEAFDLATCRAFDVAIFYGDPGAEQAGLESLGPDIFLPVCRPDVAARIGSIEDLAAFPLHENEGAGISWRDWLSLNGGGTPHLAFLRSNRTVPIIAALLDGVGVALESLRLVSAQVRSGRLVPCAIPGTVPIRRALTHLWVTTDPRRRTRARIVADLVREHSRTGADGLRIEAPAELIGRDLTAKLGSLSDIRGRTTPRIALGCGTDAGADAADSRAPDRCA